VRWSRQLLLESVAIASILVAITVGGSIATTLSPSSFANINNPASLPSTHNTQSELKALAIYYNATLSSIGAGRFENASLLLATFRFVTIPTTVNQTALSATAALASANEASQQATTDLGAAQTAIATKEYLNATFSIDSGCSQARAANESLGEFSGHWTPRLVSLSVPTGLFLPGASQAGAEVHALVSYCSRLEAMLPSATTSSSSSAHGLTLSISSLERTVDTGGAIALEGALTLNDNGTGLGGQRAFFYVNDTYFGSMVTDASGRLDGNLTFPFLYKPVALIQGLVAPNVTAGITGSRSNVLAVTVLFNKTVLAITDPSVYLPTQNFTVSGSLETTSGRPLPDAPLKLTFFSDTLITTTDATGGFSARLTVPANATDGTYDVYAAFAPEGSFGPSSNFTSIEVAHLPLSLSVDAPFSFAGFSTRVRGSAVANGTAVPDARVDVQTPWGSYVTSTDGEGRFSLDVTVSPFDLALTGAVQANVAPAQPYIAPGGGSTSMSIFNPLIIVIPGVIVGVATYEADKTGAFEGLRRRLRRNRRARDSEVASKRRAAARGTGRDIAAGGWEADSVGGEDEHISAVTAVNVPELISIFRRALEIASTRFALHFGEGRTIREILATVGAEGTSIGYEQFSRILLAEEDFLYAPSFDASREGSARRDLGYLERHWG
jgi:hypothetical protein